MKKKLLSIFEIAVLVWCIVGLSWWYSQPDTVLADQSESSYCESSDICIRGDMTGDGKIDVDDVTFLLMYIYGGGPASPPCFWGMMDRLFLCDGTVILPDSSWQINLTLRDPLRHIAVTAYGKTDSDAVVLNSKGIAWFSDMERVRIMLIGAREHLAPQDSAFFRIVPDTTGK